MHELEIEIQKEHEENLRHQAKNLTRRVLSNIKSQEVEVEQATKLQKKLEDAKQEVYTALQNKDAKAMNDASRLIDGLIGCTTAYDTHATDRDITYIGNVTSGTASMSWE